MMNIEWTTMSNNEIRIKLASMENEYESIKQKISKLIGELDLMDIEYYKGKKEIEKRSKK